MKIGKKLGNQSRKLAAWAGMACALTQLLGCTVETDSAEEADVAESSESIWYGDSTVSNLAVVGLSRWKGVGQDGKDLPYGQCTGFFITRDHLMTAAHCTDPVNAGGWYKIRVKTGYNTFTNLKQSDRNDTWVYLSEYTHTGWNFQTMQRANDTAILRIPTNASASVPANQARLRIATSAPVTGQLLDIWGWGVRVPGAGTANDLLSGNGGAKITVAGVATTGSNQWMYAYVNNNARTCQGDSGGPTTRYQDGYYIAVGDHRGPYYVDGPDSFWTCAESGVRMDWPTLYDKVPWIESTLRLAYGAAFSCSRFSAGANAYMRCY